MEPSPCGLQGAQWSAPLSIRLEERLETADGWATNRPAPECRAGAGDEFSRRFLPLFAVRSGFAV
jgi:hypothetical protein